MCQKCYRSITTQPQFYNYQLQTYGSYRTVEPFDLPIQKYNKATDHTKTES